MTIRNYDQKCWDLADHFLDESFEGKQREHLLHLLAVAIQSAVESWLEDLRIEEEQKAEHDAQNGLSL